MGSSDTGEKEMNAPFYRKKSKIDPERLYLGIHQELLDAFYELRDEIQKKKH